ncbi:MAG: branched-chain amino acid ABC transporter permease [Chloroflexi bacterium]|nr:MAG: branched-chain amino acid ABC transporter permease [Chloroflexota bacterium]
MAQTPTKSTLTQASRSTAIPRPEQITNWVLVSSLQSFILIALTPALLTQWGTLGWAAFALGAVMAFFAYGWYTGKAGAYPVLAIFYVFSFVSLLGAVLAFLSAQPIPTALIFLALAYLSAAAFARKERGASIFLTIVLVIGFVVLFASASAAARDRLNLMILFFALYTLTSGAATFIFGVRFSDLRRPDMLAFYGFTQEPAILTAIETVQARLTAFLSASYGLITGFVRPLGRGSAATGRAWRGALAGLPRPALRGTQVALLVVGLLIFPLAIRQLEMATNLSLLITMNVGLLFVVLALGLNIVVGFAGLLDLGYAAFFAIGAYTMGIFTWPNLGLEWSFWVVIWLSALVAGLFGIVIGAPTLRLRGDYLAIVTLAFGEIVPRAIREMWEIRLKIPFTDIYLIGSELKAFNLTNGPQGMNPVGRPQLFGVEIGVDPLQLGSLTISPPMQWYFLILLVGGIVLLAALRLERSRLGRAWMAIREDETAADAMGVDPVRTKLLAFALGASFSGFAGSIYAAMIQAIFPELFSFLVSIFLLILVIVSGMGNIWGVLLGGLVISLFDRVVLAQIVPQFVPGGDVLQKWRWVMYAAGLIAVMVLRPEGLFPSAARRAELHTGDEAWDADFDELDAETSVVVGGNPAVDKGGNW